MGLTSFLNVTEMPKIEWSMRGILKRECSMVTGSCATTAAADCAASLTKERWSKGRCPLVKGSSTTRIAGNTADLLTEGIRSSINLAWSLVKRPSSQPSCRAGRFHLGTTTREMASTILRTGSSISTMTSRLLLGMGGVRIPADQAIHLRRKMEGPLVVWLQPFWERVDPASHQDSFRQARQPLWQPNGEQVRQSVGEYRRRERGGEPCGK